MGNCLCGGAPTHSKTQALATAKNLGDEIGENRAKSPRNADFVPSIHQKSFTEAPFVENIWSIYHKDESLGEGSHAKVYAVTKLDNGKKYALKKFSNQEEEPCDRFATEVGILDILDHPNIVKLNRSWRDDTHNFIVTKLGEGGTLMERVRREQFLSEKFAAEVIKNVVEAIADAHDMGIVHQDLKPENLVFDTEEADSPVLVVDWGAARMVGDDEVIPPIEEARIRLRAPEAAAGRTGLDAKKGDMWSIGIIAYLLLTGKYPFEGKSSNQVWANINKQDLDFPNYLSDDAKRFVSRCLRRRLDLRCTAAEALDMAWLHQASEQSDKNIASMASGAISDIQQATRFQKILLKIAVHNLPQGERNELKATFRAIDDDSGGTISVQELADHFQNVISGLTNEQALHRARVIIQTVSKSDGLEINVAEFAQAHVAQTMFIGDGLRQMFREIVGDEKDAELDVDALERAFARSFGRDTTPKEKKRLTKAFREQFGEKQSVTEDEFVLQTKFHSEEKQKDLMVQDLFPDESVSTMPDGGIHE